MAVTTETQFVRVPETGQEAGPIALLRMLAIASVLGGLLFNIFLCFVNTRIMGINESHVILGEMAVSGTAMLAALDRRAGPYIFLVIFVSYMFLLFALRHENDIKAIRDILIPVVFYTLGTRINDIKLADRLVMIAATVALVFALVEYFFLENYLDFFNVLGYYISRGTVSLTESYGATRGLFISGNRPEPRTILPFLGQHRVSSVFLEPVSMGNFGVILYSWALFRTELKRRFYLFAVALTLVTLADARFGLFTCILITLVAPFYRYIPKPTWLVLPFIFLSCLAFYGLVSGTNGGPNDISGRFAVTAHIITDLPTEVIMGIQATQRFTSDSGFAYTLTKFGLFGFIGLWSVLVFLPFRTARAWQFRTMMLIYLLLIMVISNSFYSIKTGSLMWFLLGTVAVADLPDAIPFWRRRLASRKPAAE
jgi:putative polymerase